MPIECIMEKGAVCGTFKDWDTFLEWGNEKFCREKCQPNPRRKRDSNEAIAHAARYPRGQFNRWLKSLPPRAYQVPDQGRRVCDFPLQPRRPGTVKRRPKT